MRDGRAARGRKALTMKNITIYSNNTVRANGKHIGRVVRTPIEGRPGERLGSEFYPCIYEPGRPGPTYLDPVHIDGPTYQKTADPAWWPVHPSFKEKIVAAARAAGVQVDWGDE